MGSKILFICFILSLCHSNVLGLDKLTKKVSFQALSSVSLIKNVEIDMIIKPYYSDIHIIKIAYSTDWFFDRYESDNQFTSGFAFGSGINIEIENIELDLLMNYLHQTGFDNRFGRAVYENKSFYLSLDPKIRLGQLYFCLSGRYYFDEVKIDNNYEKFSFNFGVGINLFE